MLLYQNCSIPYIYDDCPDQKTAKYAKKTSKIAAKKTQRTLRTLQRTPLRAPMIRKTTLHSPQSSLLRTTLTYGSLCSPYVNKQGNERDNGHNNGIDNVSGNLNPVVIDLLGETSAGDSNDSGEMYGADAGV